MNETIHSSLANPTVILLLTIAILTEIAREICLKMGADKSHNESKAKKATRFFGASYLSGVIGSPIIWLGFLFWFVEIISWVMVLARVPLNIAFPMMSLYYCGTVLAGKFILGEKISTRKWVGVISITIGVAIIGSIGG